jgi:hypothetical protein
MIVPRKIMDPKKTEPKLILQSALDLNLLIKRKDHKLMKVINEQM